jgi:hypothetical protein
MTQRTLEPELLDELPPDDLRAADSRRDLRRLNTWMGNPRIIARAIEKLHPHPQLASFLRLVDLGTGDGDLLLRVLRRLSARRPSSFSLTIVDVHPAVSPETRTALTALACELEIARADVFDWVRPSPGAPLADTIMANLFLHHFSDWELAQLFHAAAERTRSLIAVEPERSPLGLFASRLVGLIGCNAVTRHDAPVSVRAGFAGTELSALWPAGGPWRLEERRTGLFGHLFVAQRIV